MSPCRPGVRIVGGWPRNSPCRLWACCRGHAQPGTFHSCFQTAHSRASLQGASPLRAKNRAEMEVESGRTKTGGRPGHCCQVFTVLGSLPVACAAAGNAYMQHAGEVSSHLGASSTDLLQWQPVSPSCLRTAWKTGEARLLPLSRRSFQPCPSSPSAVTLARTRTDGHSQGPDARTRPSFKPRPHVRRLAWQR